MKQTHQVLNRFFQNITCKKLFVVTAFFMLISHYIWSNTNNIISYAFSDLCAIYSCPQQCTVCGDTIRFNPTGGNTSYHTEYFITDSTGLILEVTDSHEFVVGTPGVYFIFAANYRPGSNVFGLQSGNNLTNLTGDCLDISEPYIVKTCQPIVPVIAGPDELCYGQNGLWHIPEVYQSYTWNTGDTTAFVMMIPDSTFVLHIQVTDSNQCLANAEKTIVVHPLPQTNIIGNQQICVGSNTQLSPDTGGTWVSHNPTVATIQNNGLATGLNPGFVSFQFTQTSNGCVSENSDTVWVNPRPLITLNGNNLLCLIDTATMTSNMAGTWYSSNNAVLEVDINGKVTPVGPGMANIYFVSQLGCLSTTAIPFTVYAPPPVFYFGENEICVGEFINMMPSNNLIWHSTNPSVASVTANGLVEGLSPGFVCFYYQDLSSGCISDTTIEIQINPKPTITRSGSDHICVGQQTHFLPSSGGIWTSNAPSIASISNNGQIVGLQPGTANFNFTSSLTGCISDTTENIEIFPRPVISLSGANQICVGDTTEVVSNMSSGTWVSSNPLVATIDSNGFVVGVAQGQSSLSYISTESCASTQNIIVTVVSNPVVTWVGAENLCLGQQANILPNTGGVWTSGNSSVATITSFGLVTAVGPGNTTFTFTENSTGCRTQTSPGVTVSAPPILQISGDTVICVGQTTQLSPGNTGVWTSFNPHLATVTAHGAVTGVANGFAWFAFTSELGCTSALSRPVQIKGLPVLTLLGPTSVCLGESSLITSSSNTGIWTNSNPLVASINEVGTITSLSPGSTQFQFTDTLTRCTSTLSQHFTVKELPQVYLHGPDSICRGSTTNIITSSPGIWTSLHPEIAGITFLGLVVGLQAGTAAFTFTSSISGCSVSDPVGVEILPLPSVMISGNPNICVGDTTSLIASSAGIWTNHNLYLAQIDSAGVVTGIQSGIAGFTFTSSGNGCSTLSQTKINISSNPVITYTGNGSLCPGDMISLTASGLGTWTSTNEFVASVDTNGLVTTHSPGIVNFTFTDNITGCYVTLSSDIEVLTPAILNITADPNICIGHTTILQANETGLWLSNHPAIASVSAIGVVTGHAPGKVSFTFVSSLTQCVTSTSVDWLSVVNCSDPDMNVGFVSHILTGDVSTNDDPLHQLWYSEAIVQQKPVSSIQNLVLQSNGAYIFSGNKAGKYKFTIKACSSLAAQNCAVIPLEITLVDLYQSQTFIANHEFVTVFEQGPSGTETTEIFTKSNEDCFSYQSCTNSFAETNLVALPAKGNSIISPSQNVMYAPDQGQYGYDQITYEICNNNTPFHCSQTQIRILISKNNAENSVVASDDFFAAMPKETVSGNIMTNDMDPEGDSLNIIPQGSSAVPVITVAGSYYMTTEGYFEFTPSEEFKGTTSVVYTLCDQHSPAICTQATIYILVGPILKLKIRAYLEGALMNNNNQISAEGRHLMRDNLRNNPFTNSNLIPPVDPYSHPCISYNITEQFQHRGCGNDLENRLIPYPDSVFAVEGDNAIVDWVYVEIRSKQDSAFILGTRSALLQRDGDIVDLDGTSDLKFQGFIVDTAYVVVRHRNHLGLMSKKKYVQEIIDLTRSDVPVYDFGMNVTLGFNFTGLSGNTYVKSGIRALYAGNFDANNKIKFLNPDDDLNVLLYEVINDTNNTNYMLNYDFSIGYYQGDFDLNGKVKFDNPNDDNNMLYNQILFFPLNQFHFSNFDFFIEQIPPSY